ncbi:extracellular catalytic domain type 1 short-chain-length polyhydroxyalkanoate depolymerase [Streptomyces turgidiscabies]|uniref:Poly(Hydroxyalkanoate) depolymerase family esterase n=1 Tax=Streptomyces turgidiscabies TaxID=85558 RepID=A0ABU0RSL1_9ACTN|nr:PHB depolymerase family esterase [Streptomyces turgidiscabies]MDQ0934773.1 poly(hydroxyalkanoate) depolymerase family esterase [Streptomyces turgidiscabies]
MRRTLRAVLAMVLLPLVAALTLLAPQPAAAASLTRVTGFGNNPTNLNMYVYVPDRVAPRPALLVLVHYCGGSAGGIFGGNGHDYVTAADRYGFVIVLPEATRDGHCFDVSSPAALRRDGGSDSTGVMSMVGYARQRYNVDPARIVVSGFSSGAMMTNVLAAEYPDVFSAASAFSGVPAGCFATNNGSMWNSQCSGGTIMKSAQQWGDQARSMYPGYTGRYPRMQAWHGTTDTTLAYPNFGEELKQWTNLHALSQTPAATDRPQSSWTRTRYGATGPQSPVEGISIAGTGHTLPQPGMLAYAITFLGLDGGGTTTPPPSTSGALHAVGASKCLDVPNASTTAGTQLQIRDCQGGAGQLWTRTGSGQLTVTISGTTLCLDAYNHQTTAGTKAVTWPCNGGANQQWNLNAEGTVTGVQSGLCLDVTGVSTANGAPVQLWTCSGGTNQKWNLS